MRLKDEFGKMVTELTARFTIPAVSDIFFPPFYEGGQPKDAEFMAIGLNGGATGLSYLLLPDEKMAAYTALRPADFIGKEALALALEFGNADPVEEMIGLAAIHAICQHVMRETRFDRDGRLFFKLMAQRKRWGHTTQKIRFRKETYPGVR
jgi:uncharacterized protein